MQMVVLDESRNLGIPHWAYYPHSDMLMRMLRMIPMQHHAPSCSHDMAL